VVEACKSLEGMREWFSSGQNIWQHFMQFGGSFQSNHEEHCDCAEISDEDEEEEWGPTSKQHHRLGYWKMWAKLACSSAPTGGLLFLNLWLWHMNAIWKSSVGCLQSFFHCKIPWQYIRLKFFLLNMFKSLGI
jgi:hypothetical protein